LIHAISVSRPIGRIISQKVTAGFLALIEVASVTAGSLKVLLAVVVHEVHLVVIVIAAASRGFRPAIFVSAFIALRWKGNGSTGGS
jgi:hypothetical protein